MIKRYFKRLKTEFKGYNAGKFGKDVLAGITVAAVALPLALAFGVPLAFVQLVYFVTAQHITDKGKLAFVFYKVADVAFEYFKRASFHVISLRFTVFLILAQYFYAVKKAFSIAEIAGS